MGRIDKIIEDATVDTYSEDEAFDAWHCLLENSIKFPQECMVGKICAAITGLAQPKAGNAIYACILIDGKSLRVPVEDIELKDKRHNLFLKAYKKWLLGD